MITFYFILALGVLCVLANRDSNNLVSDARVIYCYIVPSHSCSYSLREYCIMSDLLKSFHATQVLGKSYVVE